MTDREADVRKLKELSGKATRGPWRDRQSDRVVVESQDGIVCLPNETPITASYYQEQRYNMELIAVMRNQIEALCDSWLAMNAEIVHLRKENKNLSERRKRGAFPS